MDTKGLETLLAVALVAALAPMIVAALPGPRIPQVVILILAGILIGPQVLNLATYTSSVRLIANVGLGFLFLLAGYELDPLLLREHAGKLAIGGWLISVAISVGAVAALVSVGYVRDFVPIGLALTTTALGTLLPILHDNDMLSGRFGPYVLAAGAVGELFPIVAIALFLTHRGEFIAIASILAVGLVAIVLTILPRFLSAAALERIVRQGRRATAQTTLRWSIVLLLVLLVAAAKFGLDVVLGAMLAGMVLRSWTRRMAVDVSPLEEKLEAVGYGVFIPVFFVSSGMTLDIKSIAQNPLRLIIFFVLLLVVRGLPSLVVYRHTLSRRQRIEMTFITATTMPLLIALAEIGLSDGVMIPANAAALVGAGVLSVLVYPAIAVALARQGRAATAQPTAPAIGFGMAGDAGVVGAARAAGEASIARESDTADDLGTSPAE
jgi:Kef-type K+ transport system membrane component KefB